MVNFYYFADLRIEQWCVPSFLLQLITSRPVPALIAAKDFIASSFEWIAAVLITAEPPGFSELLHLE